MDGYVVEPFDPSEEGLVPRDDEHQFRDDHEDADDER